jgi:hypothetical protein
MSPSGHSRQFAATEDSVAFGEADMNRQARPVNRPWRLSLFGWRRSGRRKRPQPELTKHQVEHEGPPCAALCVISACRRMFACRPSQHVALKRSPVALKYDDPFRLPPDMELSIDDAKSYCRRACNSGDSMSRKRKLRRSTIGVANA